MENDEYAIYSFENVKRQPIIELVCIETMVDREYIMTNTDAGNNAATLTNLFYYMISTGIRDFVFVKNAPLEHYSVDSLHAYLPKLKWRVINNVHYAEKAANGFTGRATFQGSRIQMKKYIFVPYTLLIIPVVVDAIYLSVSRRNIVYMMHPILSWYVLFQIGKETFYKKIGKTPQLTSYDGKKKIF